MGALNLVPGAASFPPNAPQSLADVLPSFLYKEFDDDDDLAAFVSAYNDLAQIYVDWFNKVELPIYTGLSGALLDWVGLGLYGRQRPTLYSGVANSIGLISSDAIALLAIAEYAIVNHVTNIAVTNDDIYKRIITWHFYKGDGKQFSAQWIRRRALRFLHGENGQDYTTPGQNVSVIFGPGQLSLTVLNGISYATTGMIGRDLIGLMSIGEVDIGTAPMVVPSAAPVFCEAVNTGALEVPARFTAYARIGAIGVIGNFNAFAEVSIALGTVRHVYSGLAHGLIAQDAIALIKISEIDFAS